MSALMRRNPWPKYASVMTLAMRQRASERAGLLARMGFLSLLLFVYSRLWHGLLGDGNPMGTPSQMIWYLAVTECIWFAVPSSFLDVQRDVRDGTLAYAIVRPISYPLAKWVDALGDMLVRLVVFGATAAVMATALSGEFGLEARLLFALPPLIMLAGALNLTFSVTIGLTSFCLHDCRPVQWIWGKFTMLLGGLLLPLEIYPQWLQSVAAFTPFAAALHGPAHLVLHFDPIEALFVAGRLVAWLAVAFGLMLLVYRRAVRRVNVGGG